MSVWDLYESRVQTLGTTQREASLRRERAFLTHRMADTLAFRTVLAGGEERQLAVIATDNLDIKTICAPPGERLRAGETVEWAGNHWLIIQVDADQDVYARGTMQQCNYLLRWVAEGPRVEQRWCIVSDGTKYLVGTYVENEYVIERGDTRVTMILPRDKDTARLSREDRFLIDDPASDQVLAYRLSKPFKLGGTYNSEGVMSFVLTECNVEPTDHIERRIANYYDHFPDPRKEQTPKEPEPEPDASRPGDTQADRRWF